MKTCTKCNIEKNDSDYYKCKNRIKRVCKSCENVHFKRYYNQHKEQYATYQKNYRNLHKENLNAYFKARYTNDANIRLIKNNRNRVNTALKLYNKSEATKSLICCTVEEWWNHLEKQFKGGMTRDNYGTVWSIDHIIPLTFFDLSDTTERKLAIHYGNTQPLFITENLNKRATIPEKTNFKYFFEIS